MEAHRASYNTCMVARRLAQMPKRHFTIQGTLFAIAPESVIMIAPEIQPFLNTVIHGDCLEVMARLPEECVDMIFTDPPYGHGNHDGDWNERLNNHRGIENKPIGNDDAESMRRVVSGMLTHAARLLKSDCCCCCCCCGGGPKPTFAWVAQRMDEGGLSFFHSVIWDKCNPGLGWRYRRQHEMIMVAHRAGGRLRWADETVTQRNILTMSPPRDREHPNEKPLALVRRFIELHTLPGDVVLDPFAGSSTTAIACIELGRNFICIEQAAQYVAVSKRRIQEAAAKTSLFEPGAIFKESGATVKQQQQYEMPLDILEKNL